MSAVLCRRKGHHAGRGHGGYDQQPQRRSSEDRPTGPEPAAWLEPQRLGSMAWRGCGYRGTAQCGGRPGYVPRREGGLGGTVLAVPPKAHFEVFDRHHRRGIHPISHR